jgi:pantoate--beta-alanine ligase
VKIVKTVQAARDVAREWRRAGLRVGLVPTMGYLHEGHASLIRRAVSECDRVLVSIFVNPIQFGPGEDLAAYPRDMERDAALCEDLGAALIFNPEATELYPKGFATFTEVERLGENLCGRSRPTHFRGVCTVVNKLFNIVDPHKAYFGQKDAQQFAILRRMARDLNLDIEMVSCPIAREEDGLAKSSRNAYLNPEERRAAPVLHRALKAALAALRQGERDAAAVVRLMLAEINAEPLARVDYAEVVDADTLAPVPSIGGTVLAALAVYIGKTRLIDNCTYAPEDAR